MIKVSSNQTAIELSSVMNHIINSVNLAASAVYDMQQSMGAGIDTSSIEGARNEINQATAAINAMNGALNNQTAPVLIPSLTQQNVSPGPVQVPVTWQSDGLEVFTSTGVERFRQEVQSTNQMLEQLTSTQDAIAQQAYNTNIFPPEAFQNLNRLSVTIDTVRDRIQQIENNPVNIGTNTSNSELEQLRSKLNTMLQEQNELNQAMQNMDVSAANNAYLRLSQSVSTTERYIRDNVNEQGRFNSEVQSSTQQADKLTNMIKKVAKSYINIQNIGKVLNISDQLVQTTSRLDMMNDGLQSTQELVDMVYAAATDSRGSFSGMADVVVNFANNGSDVFGSSEEVVAFADLIQKQMVIAGASTTEASDAMQQLSQAFSSGALSSEELNSIYQQAPNLIQSIADYLDVSVNQLREMASEGQLSADVVKAAVFASADDINTKFAEIPATWGQIWQSMKDTALIAFQPVLQGLNNIANSETFHVFVNGAIEAMATLANIILNIFDLITAVGGFIVDNWSIISPIVYGAAAALAVYYGASLLAKDGAIMSAFAAGKEVIAKGAQAVATYAATAAHNGLNAAISECPITWIIIAVIALIAVIMMLCNWIAEATGAANSGIGIIVGVLAVALAFIGNLFVTLINTIIDIFVILWNFIAAFVNFFANVFTDPIGAIARLFFDLVDCILSMLQTLAGAIDTIFGSDLASTVQSWKDGISGWVDETFGQGEEIMATISGESFHVDRIEYGEAWKNGTAAGDRISSAIDDFGFSDIFGAVDIPNLQEYTPQFDGMEDNISSIAGDTGAMKDSVAITQEELQYMRDIAEQEAVNRYTTAEIKVDMSGMKNTVNNNGDLDGFVSGLTDAVNEAIDNMTEGVHE